MQCLWVFNKHDFSMKKNKKEVFSVEWALDTTAHFFSKVYESWTNFGHLHYLNNEAYWRDFNGFIELRIYWNANEDAVFKLQVALSSTLWKCRWLSASWRKMNAEYP